MDNPKQQIVDKLKDANNILVTVSSNPSVDQLAACIGLTLLLNKLKKHATAVFSGEIPSTIEFLKPEDTLEKNTDSLRDFIIALDKSKADKLRYKVEDKVVKIFITPYRTSITQDDLDFSQGDFNVDVVVALGVHEQKDLDQAITSHGRILHDATVASINTANGGELGTLNWTDAGASSLSELVTGLGDAMGKELIDAQVATALLTGIVAETDRFSNEKTSSVTMSISAELMTAGANQQLVATKLQENVAPAVVEPLDDAESPANPGEDNGTLEIKHAKPPVEGNRPDYEPYDDVQPPAGPSGPTPDSPRDDQPPADSAPPTKEPELPEIGSVHGNGPRLVDQPPSLGGTLTANIVPEGLDPSTDPLTLPEVEPPILSHDAPRSMPDQPAAANEPATPTPSLQLAPMPNEPFVPSEPENPQIHIDDDGNLQMPLGAPLAEAPDTNSSVSNSNVEHETLNELEEAVHSPHVEGEEQPDGQNVDSARSAVEDAINSSSTPPSLEPIAALNAQPLGLDLHDEAAPPLVPMPPESALDQVAPPTTPPETNMTNEPAPGMGISPADQPLDMPLPPNLMPRPANPVPPTSVVSNPTPPPPVPPPMTPPSFLGPNQQ